MVRICLSFLLTICSLLSFAQGNTARSIQAPKPSKLLIHTYAKGVQIYICTQDAKDTSSFTWTLKEPVASLFTDSTYTHPIGKHYFTNGKTPTWESTDGSKVTGAKLAQVNSPDANAIPWLLLKADITTGAGVLAQVFFIQRINTKGGKAPALALRTQKGQLVEVPYTAEYLFYSKD
jgi:Protein of unknown function (DUF3455)